ncbi:MAG: hypothetical protein IKE65_00560 [Clostridia bacterium]|nr:hypothetical protein [Clostridia bacterium]
MMWMTPILPYLTDTKENIETILDWCIDAGVKGIICFNIGMTLRDGDREYYYQRLDHLFQGLTETYRHQYGKAYDVVSPRKDELMQYFTETCEKHGILHTPDDCFQYINEMPERYEQLTLDMI